MAKSKPDWIKAKAMYEAGKSLRQIASETFIDHSAIGKRAKKEGWKNTTELPQLIQDAVSVEARKSTLELPQLAVVEKEIAKQLEGMQFYSTHGRIVAKIALKSLQADMTPQNARVAAQAMKDTMVLEGLVPFYPNAPQVNTQVNTTETQDKRRVFHVVE